MPPITIRNASVADAAALAALLDELGYPASANDVVARLASPEAFGNAIALVAEIERQVAGLVTCHSFPSIHHSAPVAWLTTMVVGKGFQRSGIGRQLVSAAEQLARRRGAGRVSVTSGRQRDDAHAFYRGLGYEASGVRFTRALPDADYSA